MLMVNVVVIYIFLQTSITVLLGIVLL